MKKNHRRIKFRALKLVTPLTVICGIIAVTYFFYRMALITVPTAVSLEQQMVNAKATACSKDEVASLKDPVPLLSKQYQLRVESQPANKDIFINAALTQVNPASGEPAGYVRGTNASTVTYEYLRDLSDKQLFLRMINHKDGDDAPFWQIDPVAVENGRTYAYSFLYRSNIPVQVSTEYIKDGKPVYQYVMNLKPSDTWQKFTAHFNNSVGASDFRMLLTGQGKGYVDSRAFNVRQIPDARLATGVVSVVFDDGWQSFNDSARRIMDKYHIRTTQYIVSEFADRNLHEYMNLDTVTELKRAGHEIGSHSLKHCNMTELNKNVLEDNALQSKTRLEERGLGPINSFAYPLGQYNEITQDVMSKQYPLLRTSDFGYNDQYFDETNIRSMTVLDTTSDDEFQSWIDYAKAHNLWVVIVYHRTNESGKYNVTSAQLERQAGIIGKSELKVLPLSEAADYARR